MRFVPREKAIRWGEGETQPVSGALPTRFRNPTIPAMACQRCWQNMQRTAIVHAQEALHFAMIETYHPFAPTLPVQIPVPSETIKVEEISTIKKAGRTAVGSSRVVVVEIGVA